MECDVCNRSRRKQNSWAPPDSRNEALMLTTCCWEQPAFKSEIKEMVAPAPKAVVVIEEEEAELDTEGVLRAIPVGPLEMEEAFPGGSEVPEALPVELE